MNDSLGTMLRKLRLSGLAETLEVRLHEAASNHLTCAEFLELILQDELLVRQDRSRGRLTACRAPFHPAPGLARKRKTFAARRRDISGTTPPSTR